MSIHWPIIRTCLRHPFEIGVTDDTRSYRRIEILVAAFNLADAIDKACVGKSGPVGIMLPSSGAFPIAALAAWISGRVIVPLNFLLKQEELQYVIDDCGCSLIVTSRALIEHLGYRPERATLMEMESLDLKRVPEPRFPAMACKDDLALLLYTSGTSGKPKGVMLTHGNISVNIRQCIDWVGFTKEEVLLGVLPQFHTFGLTVLTMLPLTRGCKVVYSARFMPPRIIKLFRQHRPTAMIAIPSMYNALLHVKDAGPADFASLKYAVSGGEPLPDAVANGFFDRYQVRIAEGYGLTETSPVTNWCRPQDYRAHSVGAPLPGVRERIVDPETGVTLGANADGEVRIKGPNVFQGYYRLPQESAAAFDAEGWFKTGDIGRFSDDGQLSITGRLKDMLIIGGENVFPREIEEVINHHPSVKDSGVVGMKDPMRGEQPVAFVELKEGQTFDQQSIVSLCRTKLAGYKVPEVRCVEALPRNATGKVLRRELRKLL
ncbi:MAG: AMP-binding protein [Phycisphaerales bacterium]